jgi:uncharacterized protein (DUF1499 family)
MLRAPRKGYVETNTMQTSRVASFSAQVASAAVGLLVMGPALAMAQLSPPMVGFYLFLLGGLLGLFAVVLGALGLLFTRSSTGRAGRGRALLGAGVGLVVLGLLGIAGGGSRDVPPINDITTSPSDPPVFVAALDLGPNRGRDMSYPGESFSKLQRVGYPDLAPIAISRHPDQVFQDVSRAMQDHGFEITRRDPDAGVLEATDTSRVFRFVDDIVVRIRPAAGGAVVDVRSKSRDGRSDLGANAARIRGLRDALID